MQSSSDKIILVQYKLSFFDFFTNYNSITSLNGFINTKKIIRLYVSSIQKDNLIIEVILKD
jgi:hypothetical protein